MEVDASCGDAELFESTFMPLATDSREGLGDLWEDAPYLHKNGDIQQQQQ